MGGGVSLDELIYLESSSLISLSYVQSCKVIPFVLVCSYVPFNVVNFSFVFVFTKMETTNENQCAEQLVKVFQTNLKEAPKISIPICPKKKHKPCMTPEILELMNERRKIKNDVVAYN